MPHHAQVTPRIHSYVIDHDLGFAPNPFHGTCTLACCKPFIRKYARIGDLILGTGSIPNGLAGYLCYWMLVDEILKFDDYWTDRRFVRKRPDLSGSLMSKHGDNIYHRASPTGGWLQEDSFHSWPGGVLKQENVIRDTSHTDLVMIGREFCYWGGSSPPAIPKHLQRFIHGTQHHKNDFSEDEKASLRAWLTTLPQRGCIGEPTNWPPA